MTYNVAIARRDLKPASSRVRLVEVGESAGPTISLAAVVLRSEWKARSESKYFLPFTGPPCAAQGYPRPRGRRMLNSTATLYTSQREQPRRPAICWYERVGLATMTSLIAACALAVLVFFTSRKPTTSAVAFLISR
jgi:hypothetical protein